MFSASELVDVGNEPSALNEPSSGMKLEQDNSMTSPKKEKSLGVAAADIITSPDKDRRDAEPMDATSSKAPDGVSFVLRATVEVAACATSGKGPASKKLEREFKNMSTHAEKKNIDNQLKPVLNMLASGKQISRP